MICIYNKDESNFNNNGLAVLEPMECTYKPVINTTWALEMTLPYDNDRKFDYIQNERILKVTGIDCLREFSSTTQFFRIADFKKMDSNVYVLAYPIGLDARFDTFTRNIKMYNKTPSEAISMINALSDKYTVSTSGVEVATKSIEYQNANMIEILSGKDSSIQNSNGSTTYHNFVQTYDAEVCYDNYNIKVNGRLGDSTNPIDVRYGKNVMGLNYGLDASNTISRLYPRAKSGEYLNDIADYKIANNPYVDCDEASDFPIPHIYYCEAPYNLVQLSDDGSMEYTKSLELFEAVRELTSGWLHEALLDDNVVGGLLSEIELGWIINNYDLTMVKDGVEGIVEYLWRNVIYMSRGFNNVHNIVSGSVQSLIYNAMKAGFDNVLKNTESTWYIGTAEKDWLTGSGGPFYSYEWDTAGDFRVKASSGDYVWVYTSSKWRQINDQGYATGTTDSATWKWYKVKGKTYKRYGNKKKSRYLKDDQWWEINDVWYRFTSGGQGIKGSGLTQQFYPFFDIAEIDYGQSSKTLYELLVPVCTDGEADLFELLYMQMTAHCMWLFETEGLAKPTLTLEVNMVDLSKTTEYANYQFLERVHLGDAVKIYHPKLGPEPTTLRIVGLTYDVLKECNTEIQIGVTATSVINLLNSIGSSNNDTKIVFGDSFEIVNNKIEVKAPATPYLEDVIVNGASVVRNHKAYLDLDEMGIDESIDVLYGEDAPDDETDGEDKDFYFELSEGSGHVINENDYEAYTDATHPISITSFTRVSDTEYNFNITGTPSNDGNGENIFINLTGLVEGEQYTITFDAQYSSGTTFPYYPEYDTIADIRSGTGTSLASEVLQSDTQKHSHTLTFTASAVNKLHYFLSSKDNVSTTLSITDLIIDGDIQFVGEIEEFYNKHQSKWLKYHRVKDVQSDGTSLVADEVASINTMTGATSSTDGTKGLVPQPTIADREKYLRGDGTWQDVQGASAVSDLTDVELTNLADKQILEYDAVADKWKNVANSGGGGSLLIQNAQIYSLDEKQVGVWHDGKPLYQKSWSLSSPITVTSNTFTALTSIGSEVQPIRFECEEGDYTAWQTTSVYNNTGNGTLDVLNIRNRSIIIKWFTLWYTKSTDSAGSGGYQAYGFSPIIYSEEEREVGVWIDNKPLYAKTINYDTAMTNRAWTQLINDSNITIKMFDGYIYLDGHPYTQINYHRGAISTEYSCGAIFNNEHGFQVYPSIDGATITCKVTLYYTKTTDVAGSGSYNTLGVPTEHISTDEECIGTYMGEPMYQKLFTLSSMVTLNTTAKIMDSYADFTMLNQIINATAIYDVSPEEQTIPILTFKYNNHVYMQAQTNAGATKILIKYTKN